MVRQLISRDVVLSVAMCFDAQNKAVDANNMSEQKMTLDADGRPIPGQDQICQCHGAQHE